MLAHWLAQGLVPSLLLTKMNPSTRGRVGLGCRVRRHVSNLGVRKSWCLVQACSALLLLAWPLQLPNLRC